MDGGGPNTLRNVPEQLLGNGLLSRHTFEIISRRLNKEQAKEIALRECVQSEMPYLLIPFDVSTTEANVWVASVNEGFDPGQLTLESNAGSHPLSPNWESWISQNGDQRMDYQRASLKGLQPSKTYFLSLQRGGAVRASCRITTLPSELPTAEEKPFTALLGSCFCRQSDASGRVGATYFHLPAAARPDLKILCGDQVYLDSPWSHYLFHTHGPDELEGEFFANYLQTWSQLGDAAGFELLLQDGANYFSSDDHEFWNNAPDPGAYVRDTWSRTGRSRWMEVARTLYEKFQSNSSVMVFSVGTLSFFIADTRLNRLSDQTKFMTSADLDALDAWVTGLNGPGVLVVGQPVFTEKVGFWGRFTDYGLADFTQYADLAGILASSAHSLVVLTGDVHYSRIASCRLNSGSELVEIVCSPLALVDEKATGKWSKAPAMFPAFELPGVVQAPTQTETFSTNAGCFFTLGFSAAGAKVKIKVDMWPIVSGATAPTPSRIFERWLR